MSDFHVPPPDTSGLDILFKLQALQQNRDNQAIEARRDALRTVLSVTGAGGDPSALLGQLDPATATAMQSAYQAQQQQQQQQQLEKFLQSGTLQNAGTALAPVQGTGNNLVQPGEAQKQQQLDALTATAKALGLNPEQQQLMVQNAMAAAASLGSVRQDKVNADQRNFAQSNALQAAAAGRQEAAARRAEERQMRAEDRASKATDSDEFAVNAANIVLADPSRQPDLVKEATDRFGPDAARRFEYRLANMTEAAGAKVKLTKDQIDAKRADVLDSGNTQDPYVADLAAAGKAGFDPTTNFFYPNKTPETDRRLAGLSSIYELQRQYEEAAQLFAEHSGGRAITGYVNDLSKKAGFATDPYFQALNYLGTRYRANLAYLQSGANVSTEEYARLVDISPDTTQLNIKNGVLMPSARVGFAAAREDLEGMFLSNFSAKDRGAVRNALRDASKARVEQVRQDPAGWMSQLTAPTTRGTELLQSIRDNANQSQPGAK